MTTIATTLSRTTLGLVTAGALALPVVLQAQPSAHYVPGIEGIKGASLPPPGIYLRDYNVAYFSDRLNNGHGDQVAGTDAEAFIYANVPRLVWITDAQVLGGYLGVDALLPLQYTSVKMAPSAGGPVMFNDTDFGIGDIFFEGTWSKHTAHWDFAAGYGIWAPTGNSGYPTDAGSGFWTHMITAGATYYFDAEKKWALSALNRWEINGEDDDTDQTPGQAYTLEYGLSYAVAKTVDVGLIGYYQQQVTEDGGPGATNARDRVSGVGPEVSVFYPKHTLGWSIRYAYEFMAESRFQGHTFTFTLTKRF
jgi:hypothetical protein